MPPANGSATAIASQIGALQAQMTAAGQGLARIEQRLPELSERLAVIEQDARHARDQSSATDQRLTGAIEALDQRVEAQADRTQSQIAGAGGGGGLWASLRQLDARQLVAIVLIGLALLGSSPAQRALGLERSPDLDQIVELIEARERARETGPPAPGGER